MPVQKPVCEAVLLPRGRLFAPVTVPRAQTDATSAIIQSEEALSNAVLVQALLTPERLPELERLWSLLDAEWQQRRIDPELRAAILRVAAKVAPDSIAQIEHELDEAIPAVVLEARQAELVENRPTLGAFPRRDTLSAPTADEWLREDPLRLRGVVFEACRFSDNDRQVAEGAVKLADSLGIDLRLAGDIIGAALRDARHPQAVAQ